MHIVSQLFIFLFFSLTSIGQSLNDTIIVNCKLISSNGGDKIHTATYQVLNTVYGSPSNDTIHAGYYCYTLNGNLPNYSILKLIKYQGKALYVDYYTFPDYDINKGFPVFIQELETLNPIQEKVFFDKIIKNKETAISIAESILFPIYGKNNIEQQKPYDVIEINNNWFLNGNLKEGTKGGTFSIIINSFNGEVLELKHGK
jgi:hypothetical protein